MSLVETQLLFAVCLGELLTFAGDRGIDVVGGEWWRSPEEAARLHACGLGSLHSLHPLKLAVDLTCFQLINGEWEPITDGTALQYTTLGAHWTTLHPLCRWGGHIVHPKPDYDHFSITWEGRV